MSKSSGLHQSRRSTRRSRKATSYTDAARLDPMLKKIQAILAEDCPNILLGFVGVANAWRNEVKDFKPNTGLTIWMRDVQFG